MSWEALAYVAFYAVIVYLTLFWVLPRFWRWLLFPVKPPATEAPEGSVAAETAKIEQATFEVREAIAAELRPILERTVEGLNRRLR